MAKDGKAVAYTLSGLREKGVVEGVIQGQHFVVFFQEGSRSAVDAEVIARSRDTGAVGVFVPFIEGRRLTFRRDSGKIIDTQTGSTWNLLGVATEGPLAGKRMAALEHGVYFAFAWLTFRPDTEIIR